MSTHELPERSRIVQMHLAEAGVEAAVRQVRASARTAAEAADALGCDVGAIANSLLFFVDHEPLLVMTSGRHRVDMEVLKAALGSEVVEMATPKQVRQATGQAIGGVAPTGHPSPLRTLVDETLRQYDTIWTAGGTPHTVLPLSFDELMHLTRGTATAVTRGTH